MPPTAGLKESAWHPEARASTESYTVADLASRGVRRYVSTSQAWREAELEGALERAGFPRRERRSSLSGEESGAGADLEVWIAHASHRKL